MPLILRLRHALGDTRHTLDPAGIDAPHYIGRSKEAAVQVPSMEVSSAHCAVFVHEGQWCVQDAASRGGTFVNGMRTTQPVILSRGDVVSLGRSGQSPTLQIELATDAPATASDDDALPPLEAVAAAATTENIFAPAEVPFTAPAGPRARKKSKAPVVFGVITTLVILAALAGVTWFFYQERQRQAVKPTTTLTAVRPPAATSRRTLFDVGPETPRPASAPAAPTRAAPERDVPLLAVPEDTAAAAPPPEPERDDPAWRRVLETADNPAAAVGALVEYKVAHPTSPLLAETETRLSAALDALWWRRIADIFDRRAALKEQIAEAQQEQATADVLARPALADRVKRLTSDDAALGSELKEMKYAAAAPVDVFDDAALTAARAGRDEKVFDAWRQRVLRSVTSRRGELPWD